MLNNFAVFTGVPIGHSDDQNGKGETLCMVVPGQFASNAWIQGPSTFDKVMGTKFSYIPGTEYMVVVGHKSQFRRVTNEDIKEMLPKCTPDFVDTALEILNNDQNEQILQLLKSDWVMRN